MQPLRENNCTIDIIFNAVAAAAAEMNATQLVTKLRLRLCSERRQCVFLNADIDGCGHRPIETHAHSAGTNRKRRVKTAMRLRVRASWNWTPCSAQRQANTRYSEFSLLRQLLSNFLCLSTSSLLVSYFLNIPTRCCRMSFILLRLNPYLRPRRQAAAHLQSPRCARSIENCCSCARGTATRSAAAVAMRSTKPFVDARAVRCARRRLPRLAARGTALSLSSTARGRAAVAERALLCELRPNSSFCQGTRSRPRQSLRLAMLQRRWTGARERYQRRMHCSDACQCLAFRCTGSRFRCAELGAERKPACTSSRSCRHVRNVWRHQAMALCFFTIRFVHSSSSAILLYSLPVWW